MFRAISRDSQERHDYTDDTHGNLDDTNNESNNDEGEGDVVGSLGTSTHPSITTTVSKSLPLSSSSSRRRSPSSSPSISSATCTSQRYQPKPGATRLRSSSVDSVATAAATIAATTVRRPSLGTGSMTPRYGGISEMPHPMEGLGPATEPRRPRLSAGTVVGSHPWAGQGIKTKLAGSLNETPEAGSGSRGRDLSLGSEFGEKGGAEAKAASAAVEAERAKAKEIENALIRQISVRRRGCITHHPWAPTR